MTIGALLGIAAHLEGKGSTVLDMTGLAQKGGAVLSHVRLGQRPDDVAAPRIANGRADVLIAADDVVASGAEEYLRAEVRGAVSRSFGEDADLIVATRPR